MSPPNYSLILIMICFWVSYWLVKRFLIDRLGAVVAERQSRVDSAEAEWSRRHGAYLEATAKLEARLEEAARAGSRRRAELRQEAMEERQRRLEAARATAEKRLAGALEELDGAAREARRELEAAASGLARMLASRLLEREVAS